MMKLVMVGLHSGWLGLHLSHFCAAFRRRDIEVLRADYHRMGRFLGVFKGAGDAERRDRALEELVRRCRPDVILFVSKWDFDLPRLRSYFNGTVAVYDYDGPRRRTPEDCHALHEQKIDLFFTVSRWMQRKLQEKGMETVYLPHGVDTDYYAPRGVKPRFASPLSYIGRTTDRRIALCAGVQKYGLALYGKRWSASPLCRKAGLADCIRMKRNVAGEELVDIYSSSDAVLSILQEPLDKFHTILGIQCFAVPSTAGCLIAEAAEELPEAFESGKEVLAFTAPEELAMWAEKCTKDPAFAKAVGQAGRRRCLAEHRWENRVDAFLRCLG